MSTLQTAVFAGGCFWCTEAVFVRLRGVQTVTPGFAGGEIDNPSYQEVVSGQSSAAEAIKFEYDPDVISYQDLLAVFFVTHDPTSLNKQNNDVGPQYRSAIFYATDEEKQAAQSFIDQLVADGVYDKPIVTTLEPLTRFSEADEFHKNYYEKNQGNGYCTVIIDPKLAKLRARFASLLLKENE